MIKKVIFERIEEKYDIFGRRADNPEICFIGHSQLDNWECSQLGKYKVRNCAVRGISSFEYEKYILKPDILNCESEAFVVMHGTNDIVYDYSDEQIIDSVVNILRYIRCRNRECKIFFIPIAHVNGRLDRSNSRITKLNKNIKDVVSEFASVIDISELDDEFGNLRIEFTKDGLHFSELGYEKLKQILEFHLEVN